MAVCRITLENDVIEQLGDDDDDVIEQVGDDDNDVIELVGPLAGILPQRKESSG